MKTQSSKTLRRKTNGDNMKSRIFISISAVTLLSALASPLRLAAQDNQDCKRAKIVTFEAPQSGTGLGQGTRALGINPAGAITGFTRDASNVRHGFLRARDGAFTMFDAPGAGTGPGQGTRAYSINPGGAIAGWYSDPSGVVHGYLRARDGSFTTFDVPGAGGAGTGPNPGTLASFINPAGAIAGFYTDANYAGHGFVRAPDGTITTFDAPGAGTGSGEGTYVVTPTGGINPAGEITGDSCDAVTCHGFLRTPDGTITTFDPPGSTLTNGNGINPAGAITGNDVDAGGVFHGYLRSPDGSFTILDAPGAGTAANQGTGGFGINPAGVITGFYIDTNNAMHGFARAKHGDITTFDAPGAGTEASQGTEPLANNPAGAITGFYVDADNVFHGFLRTP
jgi:hypothetical protein